MAYSKGFLLNELIVGLAAFLIISSIIISLMVNLQNHIAFLRHRSELLDYVISIKMNITQGSNTGYHKEPGHYEVRVAPIVRSLKHYMLQSVTARDMRYPNVWISTIALQRIDSL